MKVFGLGAAELARGKVVAPMSSNMISLLSEFLLAAFEIAFSLGNLF